MKQIRVMLVGGPAALSQADRIRVVDTLGNSIKILRGNGYDRNIPGIAVHGFKPFTHFYAVYPRKAYIQQYQGKAGVFLHSF